MAGNLVCLNPRLGAWAIRCSPFGKPFDAEYWSRVVPGAKPDDRGGLTGALHALLTVMELSGEPVSWEKWESGDLRALQKSEPLLAFQKHSVSRMVGGLRRGFLNFDDVGLGKTVQTIATLCEAREENTINLVLCPAFLRSQWKGEIERWAPQFGEESPRVHVLWPAADKRSRGEPDAGATWIVAYYMDVERARGIIGNRRYRLVMDELHELRNLKAKRYKQVRGAAMFAAGRIGLTGSPLYNKADKIHPMLDLVTPGDWGSYWAFNGRYASAVPGEWGMVAGALSNVQELRQRMSLGSIRRVKADVADQLPFSTKFQTVWLDPPPGMSMAGALLNGLTGLSNHLRAVAAAKNPAAAAQISADQEAEIPSLTYTWLRDHADNLAREVKGSLLIRGDGSASSRLEKISEYIEKCKGLGITPAVIATMDSLTVGANLQFAKVCNFAAFDYTPDKMHQCIGRVARMGQSGEVTVRFFAMRRTADEHYINVLTSKLSEQVKLAGRSEEAKVSFKEALSPVATTDALKELYERWSQEDTCQS